MKILSRGDRVRPGVYTVRARFARSVLLLDAADRVLFVVDRSIGPGPLNLVVSVPAAFAPNNTLELPRRLPGPRYVSALPRLDRAGRLKLLRVLETALPAHAPPDSLVTLFAPVKSPSRIQQARDERFRRAFQTIANGRLAAGVRLMRGCGEGLTPAGDDFLCGWMLACRLLRKPAVAETILENARGKNPVSNAFLELAAAGRVNRAVQRLLQAPRPARVKAACAFGHSSGADLLCGMIFGLSQG